MLPSKSGIVPLSSIGRSKSSSANLTSLCGDISPSSSHFFEVLYIGKIRICHKNVSNSLIDMALKKFETMQRRRSSVMEFKGLMRRPSQDTAIKLPDSENSNESQKYLENLTLPESDGSKRLRTPSVASLEPRSTPSSDTQNSPYGNQNRTMVFHVGKRDLRLISPDRKQILLHKDLKDIVKTLQGVENPDHFGIIYRDANIAEGCLGYVFKCECPSVALEIINVISLFSSSNQESKRIVICDHCPMVWFQKLNYEVDGISDQAAVQKIILKRIEELQAEEQTVILSKLRAISELDDSTDHTSEQNRLLMAILQTQCEAKQLRHMHDTVENRHDFLNQYLGGGAILMKAKRSLTSSFDQLLKRKSSRDDLSTAGNKENLDYNGESFRSYIDNKVENNSVSSTSSISNTANSSLDDAESDNNLIIKSNIPSENQTSMRNIFLQVGNSPTKQTNNSVSDNENEETAESDQVTSWRQAIFKTVMTPKKRSKERPKRDKSELRSLWKRAIHQQILLVRMEKENKKLHASQEEATLKRIKLDYDEIGGSGRECTEIWDSIVSSEMRKYDTQMMMQTVRQGVPRNKRGDVWMFLAQQHCARTLPPIDLAKFPNYNVPYRKLLKQLTSHQHSILIDLGRTFPNVTYYMSPLGPGQLALYNLLKAYSLLDPEVGYCQGLSFIAGILLLHMSEDQAFILLRHLMFRRNLRHQFLPDMVALQIQLYQLTRLLRDFAPDLFEHFESNEVSATLYAAPWILTMFASQFPLGFVVRIFDFIFTDGSEVIFKVILSLLTYHKNSLIKCEGFENVMEFLKSRITVIDERVLNHIIKDICSLDIARRLLEYSVEYNVLQEEVYTPRPELKKLKQMEENMKRLQNVNRTLSNQLEEAFYNQKQSQILRSKYMSQLSTLESEVRSLEFTISTLGNYISTLAYSRSDIEVPSEILQILSQIDIADKNNKGRNINKIELPKGNSTFFVKEPRRDFESNALRTQSEAKNLKFDKIVEESFERAQSLGSKCDKKPNLDNLRKKEAQVASSDDSLNDSVVDFATSYPLDCKDIQISYSGATKLKSIRPTKAKSECQIRIPPSLLNERSNANKLLE